ETATEKTSSEGTATEETADVTSAGSSELVRSETLSEGNTRLDKVSMIAREIGRQPVLCFGNSLIDESMAAYTVNSNPYRSEVFMVVADDDERDWADPEKAAELREKWEGLGWNIISMKDDFRNIYGDEAVRDKERPEIEGLIIEEEPVYTEYVVQANDNLWKIAAKAYGSGREYTKIAEANNLEAPYEVTAGQVLMIPEAVPAA
ncbi:MAG: LysM peptidoglycan-binding domain-containing protein, partial [Lachnospiraceae bacterium]|nr:LysM peptidoglycan-binding domain-containing protein [Lachnospiraceae bacterium]